MNFVDIYINGIVRSAKLDAVWYFVGLGFIIVSAYLLGSINSAIIVSRVRHNDDIRNFGSGNAGMTNILRTYGKKDAVLTLLGDMLKMVIAVIIARFISGEEGAYLAGLFGVVGHILPVYYGFKGGKGVLATATTILIIDWQIFVLLMLLFIIVVGISRYVSLGSIICGIAYPALVRFRILDMTGGTTPPTPIMLLFPMFIALLLIITHRENIKRMMNKKENKLVLGKKNKERKKYLEPDGTIKFDGKEKE